MNPGTTSPVNPRSSAILLGGLAIGLVLIVVGYQSASAANSLSDTITPLNIAVVGLIVAGATEITWLLGIRRHVSILRDRVVDVYAIDDARAGERLEPDIGLVTVSGSTAFHRRHCVLVRGKDLLAVVSADELERCPVCMRGEP